MLYSKLHQELLNLLKLNCTVKNHITMMAILDHAKYYYTDDSDTINENRANQIIMDFNIEIQTNDCETC